MNADLKQSEEAESFFSGKVARVNVAAIEKELNQLWKLGANTDEDQAKGTGTIIRAASFNLVLFSADEDAETLCSDLLDSVLQPHPCRGILSIYRRERPHQLSAWVSARCHLSGESKQICAEQITVLCEGGRIEELSSVILPLILPDLPVFLWWRHGRIERQNFAPLHECASRLLVDTRLNPFDHRFLQEIAEVIRHDSACLFVSDLTWRRLSGWCHSIADAFDGYPVSTEKLAQITHLEICYIDSQNRAVPASALLIAGWIASRLGWHPLAFVPSGSPGATFKSPTGDIAVSFKAQPGDTNQDGTLSEMRFTFADGHFLKVVLEHNDGMSFVAARLDDSSEKEITRVNQDHDEATLVGQEVEILGSETVYEKSMDLVAHLINLGG